MSKKNSKKIVGIIVICLVVVCLTLGGLGFVFGWFDKQVVVDIDPEDETPTVVVLDDDWVAFNFTNKFSSLEIKSGVNVTPFYLDDVSVFTDEQFADKRKSDFTQDTKKVGVDAGDKFDIDDDQSVVFLVQHEDCFDEWVFSYYTGMTNYVELTNKSSGVNSFHIEVDGGSTAVNQTNDRKHTIQTRAQTTDSDFVQGYPGLHWDWDSYAWNMTGYKLLFNTTAEQPWYSFTGSVDEGSAGNYGYVWFDDDWNSDEWISYDFELSVGLGVDFELISITPIWGSLDGEIQEIGSALV